MRVYPHPIKLKERAQSFEQKTLEEVQIISYPGPGSGHGFGHDARSASITIHSRTWSLIDLKVLGFITLLLSSSLSIIIGLGRSAKLRCSGSNPLGAPIPSDRLLCVD